MLIIINYSNINYSSYFIVINFIRIKLLKLLLIIIIIKSILHYHKIKKYVFHKLILLHM